MPWIHQIPVEEAKGLLKRLFRQAIERAGRVWHIVHVMSLNPPLMRDSLRLYQSIMMGDPPLSRVQREMLATVVADAYVHAVAQDWRQAPLTPLNRALCAFATKLTRHQQEMRPGDLDTLRAHGLDDRAVHDAVQVIAYFNYITRIADGLGVEPKDFLQPWGQTPAGNQVLQGACLYNACIVVHIQLPHAHAAIAVSFGADWALGCQGAQRARG
jgi:alkylhydroperoxidase family enzyme